MPLTDDEYIVFLALINTETGRNEVACGHYLRSAADILCPETPLEIVDVIQEERNHYGNSDCIVVADFQNGRGRVERKAFLWEIKAPQCRLMERDDNDRRYRPTIDLIKAENQLLHYHYDTSRSDAFRERHKIASRELIHLGGIVIGRDRRISSDQRHPQNEVAAERSLEIRESLFYGRSGFRILTWDRIADILRPPKRQRVAE